MRTAAAGAGRLVLGALAVVGMWFTQSGQPVSYAATAIRPLVIRVDPTLDPSNGRMARSLDDALDRVAALRQQRTDQPITIELAPGTYRLAHAVRIGPEHGDAGMAPLTIRGAPGRRSKLVGSVVVSPTPLRLPAALEARLPDVAKAHVRTYRLPEAALASRRIRLPKLLRSGPDALGLAVFDSQGAMAPAQWPYAGWATVAAGTTDAAAPSFTVDTDRLARWAAEPDLWAEGYWRWNWLFESLPIAGIEPGSKRIVLPQLPYEGIASGARFRIAHALSELDSPGEWWRDRADGLLLAWPRPGRDDLAVAVTDTLIAFDHASHVHLEGLALEESRGDLVSVEGGEDIVIRDSRLAQAGSRAAVFAGARKGGIEDCDIADIGRVAVRLDGGDRATLAPGGLFIRRSRITRFALRSRTQSPAVELDGVGALVADNDIHDGLDAALHIHGNDHRIVGNDIARLMTGTTDDGAIYAGRDWTARGTLIENNILHDIRADAGFELKGIYLDDFASGFTIRHNLFLRVDQPVFIGGGRDNIVERNVFVASTPSIHVDSRGETWATSSITDPQSELRGAYSAMPVESPVWRRRYPGLAGIMKDRPAVAKANHIENNVFGAEPHFDIRDGGRETEQVVRGNRGPRNAAQNPAAPAGDGAGPKDASGLVEADPRDLAGFDLVRLRRAMRPSSDGRDR